MGAQGLIFLLSTCSCDCLVMVSRITLVVCCTALVSIGTIMLAFGVSSKGLPQLENCTDGITCREVAANGLTFGCRFGGVGGKAGDVMLLHGFPEWSDMYMPLMRELATKGYSSIACNQRGYSAGAAPATKEDYNYNKLRDDIFAIADSVGFSKFHVVAHDHGAVLGWYAAGSDLGKERFLSYTALSIPHPNAFSAGLFGKSADVNQQAASQYFTMFTLPDSASIHGYFWYLTMGLTSGFHSAGDFQKALWWYNGAMDAGVMSTPPWMSSSQLAHLGYHAMAVLRGIFGGNSDPGFPAATLSGVATMPALYVCGTSDDAILCNRPYALKTHQFCTGGYTYVEADCGHDLLACPEAAETRKVMDSVLAHITKADSEGGLITHMGVRVGLFINV